MRRLQLALCGSGGGDGAGGAGGVYIRLPCMER